MKFIKWKSLIITSMVCLLPILLGAAYWNRLPEVIAIHFDISGNPDGFASKSFAVFGLPLLMVFMQAGCCVINDVNAYKHGSRVKFERATKWIIPIMTLILQWAILSYALGKNIDTRRVAVFIVGTVFLVIGNYLPKFDYIKHYNTSTEKTRKINRFIGYETVIMGVLLLASLFFSPTVSAACLLLIIPYAVIAVAYGVAIGRGK